MTRCPAPGGYRRARSLFLLVLLGLLDELIDLLLCLIHRLLHLLRICFGLGDLVESGFHLLCGVTNIGHVFPLFGLRTIIDASAISASAAQAAASAATRQA
jgi:hypothetical protein